ncbi:MAG: NUDIX hydrolase [Polaromonas sp.]|jgi:8-oxo-dGTP pyrophosphatase MutT (NUDIX family)|nr:NUDIX hydrolase [Polaromonas sp.]
MKLYHDEITTPVRDAASIVLLRDHADGLQVFLMKRHGLSDVLGGAYVFPGGKVDEADAQLDAAQYFDQDSSALPAALDEIELTPNQASALFVAALRESFEESGVLFAAQATGEQIQAATALHQEGLPFKQILQQLALRLQTQNIVPWSRWITPKMSSVSHKRFDTRFFIAALPANQTASSANHETTESIWLSPREALTSYWNKEISLAPPQIMSLVHLARHDSVASIMQQAKQTPVPLIEPQPYNMDGTRVICYPGDAQHPIPTRALPGPTRLCYRNNRFEPVDGFEALLKD